MIGRQQSRTHHHMMFRPMHKDGRLRHQLLHNRNRIFAASLLASSSNQLHTLRNMTVIANKMTVLAGRCSFKMIATDGTLHHARCGGVLQLRATD